MARSAKPRKRKSAPQRSKLPRYVVKLHEDDFLMKKMQKFSWHVADKEFRMVRYYGFLSAYSALFDHGLASKSDQRFASIRSTGNLTFSTAF